MLPLFSSSFHILSGTHIQNSICGVYFCLSWLCRKETTQLRQLEGLAVPLREPELWSTENEVSMCDFQERKKNSPKYFVIFRRQSHCQMTRESIKTCDIQLFNCNDGVMLKLWKSPGQKEMVFLESRCCMAGKLLENSRLSRYELQYLPCCWHCVFLDL